MRRDGTGVAKYWVDWMQSTVFMIGGGGESMIDTSRLVMLAAAIGIALSGCGSGSAGGGSGDGTAPQKGPIRLGFAIGKTGFMSSFDIPAQVAAQFAMDDINGKGGVGGRKFTSVTADMKSKAELAGDAATAVISKGAEILVTSCDFDMGSPAATVAQSDGKLAVSTCAASTSFGPKGIGPLAFTFATAAAAEGAATAQFAFTDKGIKTAYVLLDNTISFDKESAGGFVARWKELGGELVGQDTFKQGDQSLSAQINKVKGLAQRPGAIYLASYMPGEASALKQIRAAGLTMPVLGDEDIDGDYWKNAVSDTGVVYYSTYVSIFGDDPDPAVNDLVQRYKAKTGKLPDTAAFITGYAMVQALDAAIKGAGGSTDGKALAEQFQTFRDKPFVIPVTFTATDHIAFKRKLRIIQIKDGRSSLVTTLTPDSVPGAG